MSRKNVFILGNRVRRKCTQITGAYVCSNLRLQRIHAIYCIKSFERNNGVCVKSYKF